MGAGNACAVQSKPKFWPTVRIKLILLASVENVGALSPMGSVV